MSTQMQTLTSVLENVRIGMPVYDSLGVFVGYVLYIQKESAADSGTSDSESAIRPDYAFLEDILELVFHGDDLFTEDLERQLRTFGYMCVVNGEDARQSCLLPVDDISYVATGTAFLALPEPLLMSNEDE